MAATDLVRDLLRNRLLVLAVVVLLVLAVVAMSIGGGEEEDRGPTAHAVASPPAVRLGEAISFSAGGSSGKIEEYHWDFADGTDSNDSEAVHEYEEAGWYNVTLTVTDKDGREANATVLVAVQRQDESPVRALDRDRDVRPRWMHGPGLLARVGPNVGAPAADLRYNVVRAVGTFEINVEIWIDEGGVRRVERLHTESITATGADITFTYDLQPEELPEETATNESYVHIFAFIDQGRWAEGEITITTQFPTVLMEVK